VASKVTDGARFTATGVTVISASAVDEAPSRSVAVTVAV
jgi:hypothetical protein